MSQGGAVSWCSRKQPTVALSSCEAEYMAMSAAVQESLWWHGLRKEIGFEKPLELRCDNRIAITLSKNGGMHPRSKHIHIRHHFLQDTLAKGHVVVTYIPTQNQVADILTKPLDVIKMHRCTESLGISLA